MTVDYAGIGQMLTGAGILLTAAMTARTRHSVEKHRESDHDDHKAVYERVVEVRDDVKTIADAQNGHSA
jgi:hypothetical protein